MKKTLLEKPERSTPLIHHLARWGEVSLYELRQWAEAPDWIRLLSEAGIVESVHENSHRKPDAWALTPHGESLLDVKPDVAVKLALFQVPDYRIYLMGILAEGLALAAKADMRDRLEAWTGNELFPLLEEINIVLDSAEQSEGRLIDSSTEHICRRCGTLPNRNLDFSAWNQLLLGRTGRPQDLFDFVLNRFAPLAILETPSQSDKLPAVLRHLPLTQDGGTNFQASLAPSAWNIRRHRVQGGLSLFDEEGNLLCKSDDFHPTLQDALLEQPFYKAVVHLVISAWRSPAAMTAPVELSVPPGASLQDTAVFWENREIGKLHDLLGRLVTVQNIRIRGATDGGVSPELMENVIVNLLAFDILKYADDGLQLHPDFQASLMASRLRNVYRPGKSLQQRMIDSILSIDSKGEGDHGQNTSEIQ